LINPNYETYLLKKNTNNNVSNTSHYEHTYLEKRDKPLSKDGYFSVYFTYNFDKKFLPDHIIEKEINKWENDDEKSRKADINKFIQDNSDKINSFLEYIINHRDSINHNILYSITVTISQLSLILEEKINDTTIQYFWTILFSPINHNKYIFEDKELIDIYNDITSPLLFLSTYNKVKRDNIDYSIHRKGNIINEIYPRIREHIINNPKLILDYLYISKNRYFSIKNIYALKSGENIKQDEIDREIVEIFSHIIRNNSEYFWYFIGKTLISEYHDTKLSWYFDTWGIDNILDMLNNIKENCKGQPHYEDNVKILEDEYFLSEVDKYKKQKNNAADEAKGKNV